MCRVWGPGAAPSEDASSESDHTEALCCFTNCGRARGLATGAFRAGFGAAAGLARVCRARAFAARLALAASAAARDAARAACLLLLGTACLAITLPSASSSRDMSASESLGSGSDGTSRPSSGGSPSSLASDISSPLAAYCEAQLKIHWSTPCSVLYHNPVSGKFHQCPPSSTFTRRQSAAWHQYHGPGYQTGMIAAKRTKVASHT